MPELPDLENYSFSLRKKLIGEKLEAINVYNSKTVIGDPKEFLSKAKAFSLTDISREGKELFFLFGSYSLSVHLMLTGEFFLEDTAKADKVKNKLFSMVYSGGLTLFVCDIQAFCKVKLDNYPDLTVPDALSQVFSKEYFLNKLQKSGKTAKALIIDQGFVKGIGNAYADEILWEAKIHPESIAKKIPYDLGLVFYDAILKVLNNAIVAISIIAPDRIAGEERGFLSVHGKKLSPDNEEVQIITVASKKTYYCESQQLYS